MAKLTRVDNQVEASGSIVEVLEWDFDNTLRRIHNRVSPFVGSSIRLTLQTSKSPTNSISWVTDKIQEIIVEKKTGSSYYCKFRTESNIEYELTA